MKTNLSLNPAIEAGDVSIDRIGRQATNDSMAVEHLLCGQSLLMEYEVLEQALVRFRKLLAEFERASAAQNAPQRAKRAQSQPSLQFRNNLDPVLLVDRPCEHRRRLASDFRNKGFPILEADPSTLMAVAVGASPCLVVTEIRFDRDYREGLATFQQLRELCREAPIAVVSDSLSVANTVWAVRQGASAVLPKPATAGQICETLGERGEGLPDQEAAGEPFSLQRATWEYLSQVVQDSGSLAEAGRRLGVAPRSLRRMLAKTPPRR
jgi:ActR/RegA family two-component response regulator